MEGGLYASCVRSSMTYGNKTRHSLADVGLQLERVDDSMDVWCSQERQVKN